MPERPRGARTIGLDASDSVPEQFPEFALPPPSRANPGHVDKMFTTESHHEFYIPADLSASRSQHWRMFRLSLHAPWFVLTVELNDDEVPSRRTVGIAWDTDLVDVLESLGDATTVGLLCMTPGWCSPTGQWSAREVREVWTARTADGRVVILRDEHGHEFGDRPEGESQPALEGRRLILKLDASSGDLSTPSLAVRTPANQIDS